jgi:2-amino-4-hydroxy-6-hydroxymethyldihydropteridine diphosphokinase
MNSHEIYLLVGSNIHPENNITAALRMLREIVSINAISQVWETPAVGSSGPNFLNLVVQISTHLSPEKLKYDVLRKIEAQLGRVRSEDKNAPRPMDMDILIYDKKTLEPDIWLQAHIACPLAELMPDLVDPKTGMRLSQVALNFEKSTSVRQRTDLQFGVFLF